MSLQRAVAFVLAQETGEVVEAEDGVSRWGISQASHPELSADDIRNMTQQQAAAIIGGAQYWGACHAAELPDWMQLAMLDSCVNQGATASMVCLQRALRVSVDGKFGPQTKAALYAASQNEVLARFGMERVMSYSQDKTWPQDGEGWTERAFLAAVCSP